MPITINHVLTATTPDNGNGEIKPSHWNSVHTATLNLAATEVTGLFTNMNGVSFGLSNTRISASVETSYAASNHSHGNPTLALTNLSGTTASASNGLTLSLSANAPGAATLTVSMVGTNTTVNSSGTWPNAISLRAYGILSAGTSNGSLLLSTPDPVDFTYFSAGNSNLGNTAGDTGVFSHRMVLVGSNNITLSGSSNAGSATISIFGGAGGAGYSAGVSNVGNTSGNTGITGSNLVFSGGNGITLSQSTHANGATIGISAFTQTNQSLGIYNSSQTTGASSSSTHDARSLTIAYSGNISGGWTNGSLLFNVTTAAQTNQTVGLYATGNTTNNSSTTFDARTLGTINALGAVTAGFSNGSIQLSAPATSSLVGTSGISVSTNGSTISVFPIAQSSFQNIDALNATITLNGASVSQAVAFYLPQNGSYSYLRIPASMTTQSTTIATTAATRSVSGAVYSTWNAVIYSLGTGASSRSLQSVTSGGNSWTFMNSLSVAANGTQYSVTQGFSAQAEGAGTTRTTQYSISNTNYSLTTNQIATEWSGGRFIDIPLNGQLSAGPYWLVFGYSSSSATNSAGAWTDCRVAYSNHFGQSQTNQVFGIMGSTNLTSGAAALKVGSFSTAGGGTTNSIPLSAISSSASHVVPLFQLIRQA